MGRIAKSCLRSLLKVSNSVMGIVGIAMILYSFWMMRVWQREMDSSSSHRAFNATDPWIYLRIQLGGYDMILIRFCEVKLQYIFQWIGLLIILAQGLSILLTVALRNIGPNQRSYYNYDSDGDYAPERLPLVDNKVQPPPYVKVIADPRFASTNTIWNAPSK
ncbi:Tetraspanin-19 [Morella rubra]|uniref:Tetraspanin-19 n=1 Tax=Morella rubra TaxID=262757 RepID=A0A6A1W9L4_9ROSI|nr:Tetraspanin-19 [Morella rubra]